MTAYGLRHSITIGALVALACSAPALAQTRLYLLTGGVAPTPWDYGVYEDPGHVIEVDIDRRQVVANTPIRHARHAAIGPLATPDGRFLLWSGREQINFVPPRPLFVSLFDIARRQQTTPFAASATSDFAPLSVHPSEMRAFAELSVGGPVTVAEPNHTHTLPPPPCAAPRMEERSGDGRRLSYYCDQTRTVMVADSSDGRLLGTVPLGASAFTVGATTHVLDAVGSTMYAVDWDYAYEGDPVLYRRFDVATGALLAERRGSTNIIFMWAFDEKTGHLYAGTWGGIVVIDANTLVEIGWIGGPHRAVIPKMALDPEQPHAYIAWPRDILLPTVPVALVHTGTLATLGSIEIPVDSPLVGMALGPRPPHVSELTALVGGGLVTLSWAIDASRSIATEQVVEVGFAPGQTLLRLPVNADASSLAVAGAPPGRYYVRIRTTNGTGVGAPSNEVIVDVP